MNLSQSFKMAIKSIMSNKVRSFLTMLGIIIGVGSVIGLISIGDGTKKSIDDQIKSAGANMLIVNITGRGSKTIDADEVVEFVEQNKDVFVGVAPIAQGNRMMVKYNGQSTEKTSLEGTNEQYSVIRNTKVQQGRFLTRSDVDRNQNVVLIGTYIKNTLFGDEDPLNKNIKVNGTIFTVVGVIEEKQDSTEGSQDDKVIIPYTVAMRLLKNAHISSYYTQGISEEAVTEAKQRLQTYLYKYFWSTDAYTIFDQRELMDMAGDVMGMLTGLLAGIAAISLLVGGIGIMNIMLVSVSERTREIGIRKAIGAKRSDILMQFLIESIVVSAIGGIIGIIIGVGMGTALGKLLGITAVQGIGTIIMSFSFSMFMGVFFGLYPANKASKLNPIEALRFE